MHTSSNAKEYIREFKKRGLSIYRLAGMSVNKLKRYMEIEDSLAENIIIEARMEAEKNMMRKKSRYHDELMILPYIGVKRAEILHSKNLKIKDIAKMKPKELIAILPHMRYREAEDAIISAEILLEEKREELSPEEVRPLRKEVEVKKGAIPRMKYPGLINGNGLINGRGLSYRRWRGWWKRRKNKNSLSL